MLVDLWEKIGMAVKKGGYLVARQDDLEKRLGNCVHAMKAPRVSCWRW